MLSSVSKLAPLVCVTLLAFAPARGCGVDHSGNLDLETHKRQPSEPGGNPGGGGGGEPPRGGTPEPATFLLVAGAALGYGARRLKRRTPVEPNKEA